MVRYSTSRCAEVWTQTASCLQQILLHIRQSSNLVLWLSHINLSSDYLFPSSSLGILVAILKDTSFQFVKYRQHAGLLFWWICEIHVSQIILCLCASFQLSFSSFLLLIPTAWFLSRDLIHIRDFKLIIFFAFPLSNLALWAWFSLF